MATRTSILSGTAFITGAGSGIGRAAALAYALAGATGLAISDVNDASIAETVSLLAAQSPHVDVLALHLDTTQEQAVKEAIAQTVAKFGRIDVAMNVAGIAHGGLTHECEYQAWSKVMDVNINGVWMCQREELKAMLKQEDRGYRVGRGVIINISSLLGILGGPSSPYTAAKHAVLGITKNDALQYAPHGIRINAICPGWIRTNMTVTADSQVPGGFLAQEADKTPLRRLGEAEEIADILVFLGSKMSSYMTGTGIVADGGLMIGMGGHGAQYDEMERKRLEAKGDLNLATGKAVYEKKDATTYDKRE